MSEPAPTDPHQDARAQSLATAVVLVVAIVVAVGFVRQRPLAPAIESTAAELLRLQAQNDALRSGNLSTFAQIETLTTLPHGEERLARKTTGYVRANELVFDFSEARP